LNLEKMGSEEEQFRRDISRILASKFTFSTFTPQNIILTSLEKLLLITNNVIENISDVKYRKIKVRSQVFVKYIETVDGAVDLLILYGWKKRVIEFEEFFVLESEDDFKLIIVAEEIRKRIDTLKDRQNLNTDNYNEDEERNRIVNDIKDDHENRKVRYKYH